jgi:hypothetical protein
MWRPGQGGIFGTLFFLPESIGSNQIELVLLQKRDGILGTMVFSL